MRRLSLLPPAVIAIALISGISQVEAQQKNPDKLPLCTKADYPRQLGEARYSNGRACWGRCIY